jgi:two-component system, LuxR family, response regulator FixJ
MNTTAQTTAPHHTDTSLPPVPLLRSDSEAEPSASRGLVFMVDDNDGFRNSTRWLLEGHGYQVEAFASPRHFLAYLQSWPDDEPQACVLLDVRMPEMSGLEVQDALRQRGSNLPIVFISGHGDLALAVETMRKGAAHFIEKPFGDEALVHALDDALQRVKTLAQHTPAPQDVDDLARRCVASLTLREKQVLDLVLQGKLNKVIADDMGISIKTVELHRSRVMHKMKVKSVAQLVQLAMRAG